MKTGAVRRLTTVVVCGLWAVVAMWAAAGAPLTAAQSPPAATTARCRVDGHVRSGTVPLPGASIVVQSGDTVRATSSTDADGAFVLTFAPNATYRIAAELTAFTRVEREITLAAPPCDTTVDLTLALRPRRAAAAPSANAPAAANGRGGRGGQPQRFQELTVASDANGAAALEATAPEDSADVTRLLPPGFTVQTAQADAIAINGSGDATSLDRGSLNDRLQAIRLGEFDPATGQFAGGLGQPGANGPGGPGGPGDGGRGFAGRGGPGGGGPGGRGPGGGGRGGFVLAGRGARGQSPYQGSTTYTFGGSALDTPPYQLRPDVPVTQPQFTQNGFGGTFGGPVKIPGLYANENRRTNFQVNYTGSQNNNLFDQYATVPTDAMRAGDFSGSGVQLVDPRTGQAFAGNQIPASRIDPSAAALLGYIPAANLPGTTQNYHVSTTSHSSADALSLRVTQNLSPTVPQGGGRGGGRAGGGGGRGGFGGGFGPGGRGGRAAGRGTNIILNGQLQYRRNSNEQLNVFPNLGGATTNTSISVPITLNVVRNRQIQNFTANFTHASVETTNAFSNTQNVAGNAGIQFPGTAASDPLNWGVPNLLFSGFTGVRSSAASLRDDDRLTLGYFSVRPTGTHQVRYGGDYRRDTSTSQNNSNARGSFTFTGLYSSAGQQTAGLYGTDFADFLLGVPQQASLQVGDTTHLRQHSFDVFVEDNWQKNAKLTFNLGLRYELARPYVELDGRMANLDVTPTFTAAQSVTAGGIGPYTGQFPAGLLNTDVNNLGPRLGVAYRIAPRTVLRGGYSITYNSGSYASIARQLVGQPPAAETETVVADASAPLTLADALLGSTASTTNNFAVDRDYALGTIQTWNAILSRDLSTNWQVVASYTGTKGTNLDILRAPNRGPLGLLIPGVQAFTWESSGGHSILNAGNFQVRRRLAGGFSGDLSYTLAKSMDNASSLGAGAPVVAQNDQNLGAEWALSNFDRRHQVSGDLSVELPFGANRRWLKNGGFLATVAGDWTATMALTVQSGTPLTARILGAASDVSRGVSGSLRADVTGQPIQLDNPVVTEFFNAAAFSLPLPGTFGDSSRNVIIGPGQQQLNGVLTRDVRLANNRVMTLQINALNLLNTVQWATVDTNRNSPTFGYVLSARPMRTITLSMRFRF